jgi:hypothetical protein
MTEEQNRLKIKTKNLTDRMHRVTEEQGFQHLGSESKMELNLMKQANDGIKTTGDDCDNHPVRKRKR